MKVVLKWILMLSLLCLLAGCWDLYDVQDLNYSVAIGLDYNPETNKYIAYSQMLDFSFVAKRESNPGQEAQVYIGRSEGDTINMAISNLYQSSQIRTLWSHVTSVVFTERLLQNGLQEVLDGYTRYSETRLSQWAFATNEPIDEIFAAPAFFNLSSLVTLLHKPEEILEQKSFVDSLYLKDVFIHYNEPGKITKLPSLKINRTQWKKNLEPTNKLEYNGVYVLEDHQYKGFISLDEYKGYHWVNEDTKRYPLMLEKEGKKIAVLVFDFPKIEMSQQVVNDEAIFNVHIKMEGNIVELLEELPVDELEELAESIIEDQVKATYDWAKKRQIDLYELEYFLYTKHYKDWKEIISSQDTGLENYSLNQINVEVNIDHSGLLKPKELIETKES
ncbi:Ger(x)C family spore germination protein [Alkalihalobacillus trypoxylicola]|nr:Ger(x)C family spore germination protein [Alkalihalobacillus trypoxylicola]